MLRLRRIIFDIAAQTHDKVIDRTRVGVFVQVPYFFEDGFSRNYFSIVAYEVTQEFGFHQGEMDGVSESAQFEFAEINCLPNKAKHVWSALDRQSLIFACG